MLQHRRALFVQSLIKTQLELKEPDDNKTDHNRSHLFSTTFVVCSALPGTI